MQTEDFRHKRYWLTTRDDTPNPALTGKVDVDVDVIGGGFTGLSTAYRLKKAEPDLKVALLEAQVKGKRPDPTGNPCGSG